MKKEFEDALLAVMTIICNNVFMDVYMIFFLPY